MGNVLNTIASLTIFPLPHTRRKARSNIQSHKNSMRHILDKTKSENIDLGYEDNECYRNKALYQTKEIQNSTNETISSINYILDNSNKKTQKEIIRKAAQKYNWLPDSDKEIIMKNVSQQKKYQKNPPKINHKIHDNLEDFLDIDKKLPPNVINLYPSNDDFMNVFMKHLENYLFPCKYSLPIISRDIYYKGVTSRNDLVNKARNKSYLVNDNNSEDLFIASYDAGNGRWTYKNIGQSFILRNDDGSISIATYNAQRDLLCSTEDPLPLPDFLKKKINPYTDLGFIQITEDEKNACTNTNEEPDEDLENLFTKNKYDFTDEEKKHISMIMAYIISQNINWIMDQSIRVRENNSKCLGWLINRLLQVTYMRMEIIDFIVFLINSGAFEAAASYVALTSVCMFIRTLIYHYRFITHMRLWYMLGNDYWYMHGDDPNIKIFDIDKFLGCFGNELLWGTFNTINLIYNLYDLLHHPIKIFASHAILSTNIIFTIGYCIDFLRDLIRDALVLRNIYKYGIYQGRTLTGAAREKAIKDQWHRLIKQTTTNFGMLCGRLLMSAAWIAMVAGKTTVLMTLLPIVTTLFSVAFLLGFLGLAYWAHKYNKRTVKNLALLGAAICSLLVIAAAISFVSSPLMAIAMLGIVATIAIGALIYVGYQISRHNETSNKAKWLKISGLAMCGIIALFTVPTLALTGVFTLPLSAIIALSAVAAVGSGLICYAILRKSGVEKEAAIRFSIEVGSVLSSMIVGFTIAALLTCPLTAPIILVPIFAALILFACRAIRKFDLLGNKDEPDSQDSELYSFNENANKLFHNNKNSQDNSLIEDNNEIESEKVIKNL